MCMGGGGGGGGVITMPDTGAYDRMQERQIAMMQMAQSSELTGFQSELDSAVMSQQNLLRDLRDLREERADEIASVEAEARRKSNIIGTPPPAETAKAPVVGKDRENKDKPSRQSGKRGLRISRPTANSTGEAVGLNII
tara:strand:+ start:8220 stop:8636 length:417 start_codon:yes stop_codon:yes gene_type:complete